MPSSGLPCCETTAGGHHDDNRATERRCPTCDRPPQHGSIERPEAAHEGGILLLDLRWKQQSAQGRGHREGGNKAARDGVGVRLGHGSKDVAFDTGERKEGKEADDNDCCREEDRPADARSRKQDVGERCRVGVRLDVEALEEDASPDQEAEKQHQHEHAMLERHANEGLHLAAGADLLLL